jgi:hypothetical protein
MDMIKLEYENFYLILVAQDSYVDGFCEYGHENLGCQSSRKTLYSGIVTWEIITILWVSVSCELDDAGKVV